MTVSYAAAGQPVGYLPPPPGVTPDFDNPTDDGHMANIVGISVCSGVATLFVCMRAYVRIFIHRRILFSDVTCLIGYLLYLTHAGTAITMTCYGLGYPLWEVTPQNYENILKWLYAASVVYIPAAFFIKVTIILLIAHVFAIRENVTRGIYIFIYAILVAYIPIQTLKVTACHPIKALWDRTISRIGCMNLRKLYIADLVVAVVTDIAIVAIPIPIIWSLPLPWKEKLKVLFMLSAGAVAVGITLFRLVKISIAVDSPEISKDFVILDLTAHIELTIGLICACLPSAQILWKRLRTGGRRGSSNSNRPRSGHFQLRDTTTTTTKASSPA